MSKLTKILWGSWSWKRPLYSIILVYFALGVVAIFFAEKLIFYPPSNHYNEKLDNLILIKSGEQTISTVHYPAGQNMPTILWSHGNAEDIGLLIRIFKKLNDIGYGIFAYDYPGYGLSTGKPTESSCYKAADIAYKHLTKTLKISSSDIILLGQSIGTGPTHYLAEEHQPSATILLSPFTSIYRVGIKYSIYPRDRFPNIKRIKKIKTPVLFIHGENDQVIPIDHSQKLITNHSGINQFLKLTKTGHNDIYSQNLEQVIQTIHSFIKHHHQIPIPQLK